MGLEADLFALDATVIELRLALCPWARWQKAQASVKLSVMLDVRTDGPAFASLDEGQRHEVATRDEIPVYPGSYYVIDRGCLDFARLYRLHTAGAFFVTRLKTNPPLLRGRVSARGPDHRLVLRSDDPPQFAEGTDQLPCRAAPDQLR